MIFVKKLKIKTPKTKIILISILNQIKNQIYKTVKWKEVVIREIEAIKKKGILGIIDTNILDHDLKSIAVKDRTINNKINTASLIKLTKKKSVGKVVLVSKTLNNSMVEEMMHIKTTIFKFFIINFY